MRLLVGNIQRFCVHDGPGIRTTVFLKGCPLSCPWCANPENRERKVQTSHLDPNVIYGKWMDVSELLSECLKDSAFHGRNGGVTFSGGEPFVWVDELLPLLQRLRAAHASICIETCLFAPADKVRRALGYFDHLLIDVKILEPHRCKEVLGGDLDLFYENLAFAESSGAKIVYRVPMVEGYTFDKTNTPLLKRFMLDRPAAKFDVFQCHGLAADKYSHLGLPIPESRKIDAKAYREFLSDLRTSGVDVSELSF